MKIGYLKTSSEASDYYEKFRNHSDTFRNLLSNEFEIVDIDVYKGKYPENLNSFDGYIIPGGHASVNNDEEWIKTLFLKIKEIYNLNIPLVGICFGHQAIAKSLGGEVKQNPQGLIVGTKDINFSNDYYLTKDIDSLKVNTWNSDEVVSLPKGAKLIASTSETKIHSFCIGKKVLTFQSHPEFDKNIMIYLIENDKSYLSEADKKDSLSLLEDKSDGQRVGEIINRFFIDR